MIPPDDVGQPLVWDVAALVQAVGDVLLARFGAVVVRGEIAGYSRAASGHSYFNLRSSDGDAALRCAMFRRAAALLDFVPRDGQQVELRGRLAVYEPRGELQLIVEAMRPAGAGALMEQFLRLKDRLEREGLFDAQRKRSIEPFPRALGVVTSTAAAALHDVLTALRRRAPQVRVVVYPTSVQGVDAPGQIAAAIGTANARAEVQTLLLCRGGGSLEDLWAFNDERVVRAIVASRIPIVTGVGHETDFTLADFASDLRAPTPTAAAELAAPPRDQLLQHLAQLGRGLSLCMSRRVEREWQRIDRTALRLARPSDALSTHQRRLTELAQRLARAPVDRLRERSLQHERLRARWHESVHRRLQGLTQHLALLGARHAALDPAWTLKRGYAWLHDEEGVPITSTARLQVGSRFAAVLQDGRLEGVVERIGTDTRELP